MMMQKMSKIKLRFGKYKGVMLKDIPAAYLKWCLKNDILRGKAMVYAKIKCGCPRDEYQVTVKDSVDCDGVYNVEAYSVDHAIFVCRKDNKIRLTQSFCGTTFSAVKLK